MSFYVINSKTGLLRSAPYEIRHDLKQTHVKMPPNLSMSTGFGLFRKSNLRTAHEHVANGYIDAYIMYVH